MMKTMLQDFAKKKDKVLMDRFKQHELLASSLSSYPGAPVKPEKKVAGKVIKELKAKKPEQVDTVKIVIRDEERCEHRTAKFQLGQYRHACNTCKMMRDYAE